MSLKQGIVRAGRNRDRPVKSMYRPGQILTLDSNDGWWLEEQRSMAMSTDKAMKISTVNRCVEVLSTSMAVLPIYIMEEATKERKKEHRLGNILWHQPNEAMTMFDYARLMMNNEVLRGNGYAWIFRDRLTGYPKELIPLPPDYVTIRTDYMGHLWYVFNHPVTGQLFSLRPEDVLHYKAYTTDGIEGISILKRASMTLDTSMAAQKYENSTWHSGGQPSGILTTDSDLGDTVRVEQEDGTWKTMDPKEQLRQSWEKLHRGADNAMRIAVLDLGLKYQPISMTNSDAQFVESNEIRVADICRFFGVPLHLAYAGKQSYASNEQNGIEFVRYTLLGYETQWGQEDTRKLLLPDVDAGLRIKRELKVFLRGDTAAQAQWYRTLREIGAYSVDDILALEDMPKVPGGGTRYASWNYGPLELFEKLSVIRALGGKMDEEEAKE